MTQDELDAVQAALDKAAQAEGIARLTALTAQVDAIAAQMRCNAEALAHLRTIRSRS
jgi:hypothetical protein